MLDLGCGTATLSIMLKEPPPGAEVIGLDGDEKALLVAQKKSPALFLPATGKVNQSGQLSVNAINAIWNSVCQAAGVKGKLHTVLLSRKNSGCRQCKP